MKYPSIPYNDFLRGKRIEAASQGLKDFPPLNDNLYPHQKAICQKAIEMGRYAIFAKFGLGKTVMQLQLCQTYVEVEGGCSLIVAPLGVRQEFKRDAKNIFGIDIQYVKDDRDFQEKRSQGHRHFITNYERVREGKLNPENFLVTSLDEASVLRSFGSKTYQEFLPKFANVKYRFVATATPAPNKYKEIIHYAGYLGVMDTANALTRFFKRDSSQAGNLKIHPHKEKEFWLWVASWACFVQKPSDIGFSDNGYELPPLKVFEHRLEADHSDAGTDSWGQHKIFADDSADLSAKAKERRKSIVQRCTKAIEIIEESPEDHFIIWTEMNDEAKYIERYLKEIFGKDAYVTAHGVSSLNDLDQRERDIVKFSDGLCRFMVTKPKVCGSGCNFQRHCHRAIFLSLSEKFNDFIQSVHRIYRFLQKSEVQIDLIWTSSQDSTYDILMKKWQRDKELGERMSRIIKEFGLNVDYTGHIERSIGCKRVEVKGQNFKCVHNDNVEEYSDPRLVPDNSIGLFVTSWPFSDQYEYTPSYNDFGHNDGDDDFFAQMDYLTPHMFRALKPGRIYCLHVKNRIVFGYQTPYGHEKPVGRYSVNPFAFKCIPHMVKHGFVYDGTITIDTDVVRENNQTNRLTRGEMRKDGTKMGVGMPEYVHIFYKPQTDSTKGYADEPVTSDMDNDKYQLVASPIWRSDGMDTFLTPEKIQSLPLDSLKSLWKRYAKNTHYNFEEHVAVNRALLEAGKLPGSFMLLPPHCRNTDWIWEDVARMQTLNCKQSKGRKEMHTCPLQFDVVRRLIERYSKEGDLVADPFGGLMTVPYIAIEMGRKGFGVELNPQYFADGLAYCKAMEYKQSVPTLWDLVETEKEEEEAAMAA